MSDFFRRLPRNPLALLLPLLLLVVLTNINHTIWPYSWPDEALFSSPAASLSERGVFATPVLTGLIPGMERATLWNSPLYMVLLSGLYYFSGESQDVARALNLVLGLISLLIFYQLAVRVSLRRSRALLLTFLLALDMTFQRAANTARMDMLTFTWILTATYLLADIFFISHSESGATSSRATRRSFLAGAAAGLAVCSHPAGLLLAPLILIFTLPRVRLIFTAIAGGALPLSAWLVYIVPNLGLFKVQFLSQLQRKSDILSFWGGDTGGIFVVFFSQYGGGRIVMAGAALLFIAVAVAALPALFASRHRWREEYLYRLFAAYITVTLLILLASEAWYPLYAGPFLLLLIGLLSRDTALQPWLRRGLLGVAICFFLFANIRYLFEHHVRLRTPARVTAFQKSLVGKVRGCRSVYLRVRPDPYFRLRRIYPRMEVLEFIPGKLQVRTPDRETSLLRRYDSIDCFLLDGNDSWEPLLTRYLRMNSDRFRRTEIPAARPLDPAFLYRRAL